MHAKIRHFSSVDQWLISFDRGLKAILNQTPPDRPNPATDVPDIVLSQTEQKKSAALLRVDHAGEICAQALYQGQALTTRHEHTRKLLFQSAQEEMDHLAWCQTRLNELNSHPSYLNFLWYSGSFFIGMLFGLLPPKLNLGFVAETEHQVMKHLETHLEELPPKDLKSRAILEQMLTDEAQHATQALKSGGEALTDTITFIMKITAKIMTTTACQV